MTFLLVLEFETEEEAKRIVEYRLLADKLEYVPHHLVGAFKKPDDYCKCGSNRPVGWKRGSIFGWWVCPRCNKVSRMVLDNFCQPGINLLPNEVLPPAYQHDEHSKYEWSFDG